MTAEPPVAACPSCGLPVGPQARFCGQCGAAQPRRCGQCGAALGSGQRFCTGCGAPVAAAAPPHDARREPPDEGERRHATVMFSDLSGYTALNERMDPEEVSRLMGRVRETATRVVEAHGGIVNQVVGDEVMALFGVPHAGRDDALRAVRAALALNGEIAALAAAVAAEGGPALAVHTGIHTGLVVVRPCDPRQGRHALTGDTVNTAARLLKLAEAGEIVVGETTWRAVMPHVAAEPLPPTPVRGKREPLPAWRIEREIGGAPLAPMVGRDDEWRQAASALDATAGRGQARLVVIRGEAGIGKSRLLQALADEARRRGLALARGQVPDFGPSRGAAAWRQVAIALLDDAGPAAATAALERAVEAGELDPLLRPHLCALAELPLPAEAGAAYAQLDAAARERGTVDALAALARRRAATQGLMVAVEDAHWAEPAALTLLARVAAACRQHPLLLAVTTRPESAGLDLARRTHARDLSAVTIDLAPLGDDAALAIAARFELSAPEVVARCVQRAGGNPLFLEQLLLSATEALREALPGSIQALVLARLDRLAPADKAMLQAASVLGQHFDAGALRWLIDAPGCTFEPLLEAGLVREAGDAVQFAHALIRDGAYESLLKSRRRELHLRAAQWYATRDRALQAEHLDLAASPLAAAAYVAAGQEAAARFRYEQALALAQRGLACAEEGQGDERHALALLAGEALREAGRNTESLAAFETARDLAPTAAGRCAAWLEIANIRRQLADGGAARAALDEAEPLAQAAGDARALARIHYLRGNLEFARGDGAACMREHQQALALARDAGDVLGQAQALSGLGDAHYLAGRMRSAREAFGHCVQACGSAGALRFAVMNRMMVGWCHFWCGEPEASLREIDAAAVDARRLSHLTAQAMGDETLGLVLNGFGRHDEAREVNERAVALARAVGHKRFEIASLCALAANLRRAGDQARALSLVREACALVREVGAHGFAGPLALVELARQTADRGERDRLLSEAEETLARGAVAHNHFFFRADAIQLRLDEGAFDEVLRHADALERYVAAEPIAFATHHVAAARALVRHHRGGERDGDVRAQLQALAGEAARIGLADSRARLEGALAGA
jgi:class 3 adenylate cyclase/tetratricopeptide (TPR) repeat protein